MGKKAYENIIKYHAVPVLPNKLLAVMEEAKRR